MTEEEIEKDFLECMKGYEKFKRKRAIKALFNKEDISSEIKDFNYIIRIFCWLKTLICLILNRNNGSYLDTHKFCILSYDESQGYESSTWEAVWVSPCLFEDWNICIATDGT